MFNCILLSFKKHLEISLTVSQETVCGKKQQQLDMKGNCVHATNNRISPKKQKLR